MIITRKIINPDIKLQYFHSGQFVKSHDYTAICRSIDLWKMFFVEAYKAQPGQTVLLDFDKIYVDYIGAFFACAELKLILIDRISNSKIDYYVDFREKTDLTESSTPTAANIILKDYWLDYRPKDKDLLASINNTILSTDTDQLTTSVTHDAAYKQSGRFVNLLRVVKGESGLLIQNIHHHTYSLCYHFLPVLMQCDTVYTWAVVDNLGNSNNQELHYLSDFINENKINHVAVSAYPSSAVTDYLSTTPAATHKLKLKTVNHITRKTVELIKEKNVDAVYSIFLSADTTVGYFVKTATANTDMTTFSRVGYDAPTDELYQFEVRNHDLYVASANLGIEWTTTGDKFIITQSGEYQYSGQTTV